MIEPAPVRGDLVKGEKSLPHSERIAQIRPGSVEFIVTESAAGQGAMRKHPLRGTLRLLKIVGVATRRVKIRERRYHPAVLARVEMFVNARNALCPAACVVQLEVVSTMLAFDQIRILAYIECSIRTGEKRQHIVVDSPCDAQIRVVLELRICERINAHDLRLNRDQLLEVRLVPITTG